MPLSKKEINQLFKEIQKQIIETKNTVEGLMLSSKPVKLDQQGQGRVSRVDAIQQQQMNLASLKRFKKRLEMLLNAQKRLSIISNKNNKYEGDFNVCLNCEEEIDFKRLMARPESRLCIKCSSKRQ